MAPREMAVGILPSAVAVALTSATAIGSISPAVVAAEKHCWPKPRIQWLLSLRSNLFPCLLNGHR